MMFPAQTWVAIWAGSCRRPMASAWNKPCTAMQDGEISEPFQTETGWHIIERLGMREKDVTVEAVRNAARNNLQQQKMDIELEQFLQEMRDEAFVEIRLDS